MYKIFEVMEVEMKFLESLLIHIFNMSISASFVIIFVLVFRLLLKNAPKLYSYLLWLIVFIRLICPFTIQSALSLIPVKQEAIQYEADVFQQISFNTGVARIDSSANNAIATYAKTPFTQAGFSTSQILLAMCTILWLLGILAIFIYVALRYVKLKSKLKTATLIQPLSEKGYKVYETDQINSPFLLGVIKPRIYFPVTMKEEESRYVLQHEQMHLKRKDYLVKPFCFLVLVLHWFNPLVWVAFLLMEKDMELSCDEAVIRSSKVDIRSNYSLALLNASMKLNRLKLPIAFGESNTKNRIKNVLNFKKLPIWISILMLLMIGAIAVSLMTSAKSQADKYFSKKSSYQVNKLEGVVMTVDKSIYAEDVFDVVTVTLENKLNMEVLYGDDYLLEKNVSGKWYSVETQQNLIFNEFPYILGPQNEANGEYSKSEIPQNMDAYRGQITAGKYRIITSIIVNQGSKNIKYYLGAEFNVGLLMKGKQNEELTSSELHKALVDNRTPYIGDNSKDYSLLSALPLPEGVEYDYFELQTKQEPYELTIYYNLVDGYKFNEVSDVEISNAVLLFATIENMSFLNIKVNAVGASESRQYVREDYEKYFGDLYPYSETSNSISELIDKIQLNIQTMQIDIQSSDIQVESEANAVEKENLTDLEYCISNAIIEFNNNSFIGEFQTESHVILDTKVKDNLTTIYTMALYQEYGYEDGEFKSVSGNHMPIAVTFLKNNEGEYSVQEYWIPKDGSYYGTSIKDKFPKSIVDDAMDTQKYIKEQQKACDEKAREYLKTKEVVQESNK